MTSVPHARIIDQNGGVSIKLPRTHSTVIGLSVSDKLVLSTVGDNESGIVLELFTVEARKDGHWLLPSPDLPSTVNDDVISQPVLLSHGTIIGVGDRVLEYKYPLPRANLGDNGGANTKSTTRGRPPPKPLRAHGQASIMGDTDKENLPPEENIVYSSSGELEDDSIENELTKSQVVEVRQRLKKSPGHGVDEDLLGQITSKDQLSSVVASLVVQQAVLCTDLQLTASEVDMLFRSFQTEVTGLHEGLYRTFLEEYQALSAELSESGRSSFVRGDLVQEDGGQKATPLQCELHDPVIVLLTEMLRITPFPLEHVIIWLTLLRTFSHFLENINVFIREKTAAVVMGCMSAHAQDASVQQQGCGVLAQLARYIPVHDEKGPIRESGVELICRAMLGHAADLYVLRPACRALANLTTTYANFTNKILDDLDVNMEDDEQGIVRAMMILDYIRERGLPSIQDIYRKYSSDHVIHVEAGKVIAFFTELHTPAVASEISEPDLNSYNIKSIRKHGQPSKEVADENHNLQSTMPGPPKDIDSLDNVLTSEQIENELGNQKESKIGRRVQFSDEILEVEQSWSELSSSVENKCARWLQMEGSVEERRSPSRKVNSLYNEVTETEKPDDPPDDFVVISHDGDDDDKQVDVETKHDAVAKKLGLAGVVKGYFRKIKDQISPSEETKPLEEAENVEKEDNFKPVLTYTRSDSCSSLLSSETTEVQTCTSSSDSSSVPSDDEDESVSSSQEWDQIQSGIYCKIDKSDRLPKHAIRPLESAGASNTLPVLSTEYKPRFLKKGQSKENVQDSDALEKEVSPKGILKSTKADGPGMHGTPTNLSPDKETSEPSGSSNHLADAETNAIGTEGAEVPEQEESRYSSSSSISFYSSSSSDDELDATHSRSHEPHRGFFERSPSFENEEFVPVGIVSNMKKHFSKSEPALNELQKNDKRRKSSLVVSSKIKKYIDKLKDASLPSPKSFSLPRRSKKYNLQKVYQSRFGNDEFLMRPTFHLETATDKDSDDKGSSPGLQPSSSDKGDSNDTSAAEETIVTKTIAVNDETTSDQLKITVMDTTLPTAPPRRAKRHSIAAPEMTKETCKEHFKHLAKDDLSLTLPHQPPAKAGVSPARKRGISGALKGYMKKFQRRKSDTEALKTMQSSGFDVTGGNILHVKGSDLSQQPSSPILESKSEVNSSLHNNSVEPGETERNSSMNNNNMIAFEEDVEVTDTLHHTMTYMSSLEEAAVHHAKDIAQEDMEEASDIDVPDGASRNLKSQWKDVMTELKITKSIVEHGSQYAAGHHYDNTQSLMLSSAEVTGQISDPGDGNQVVETSSEIDAGRVEQFLQSGESEGSDVTSLLNQHESVFEVLYSREQVIRQYSTLLEREEEVNAIQLAAIVKYTLTTCGQAPPTDKDAFLLKTDTALGLTLVEIAITRSLSTDCSLKLLQNLTERLDKLDSVYHRHRATVSLYQLITGQLAQSIQGGWGFFTLRRINKITAQLLQEALPANPPEADDIFSDYRDALSKLHQHLDRLITWKV